MSKSTRAWLASIAVMALEAAAFIAWKRFGINAAGNVLLFWLWFLAVTGVLVLVFLPRDYERKNAAPKSALRTAMSIASTVSMIAALAWFGHFVVAAFYTLGQFGFFASENAKREAA
ncbi:hypothetical protein [Burkholderia multivorans]|uniref:hypothetical protein n=1 Tax=Burkholderia multivorans TaxID=87883 RepID=UPI0021C0E0A4|nr:hypothetical protein [Burkholderia multivorans]